MPFSTVNRLVYFSVFNPVSSNLYKHTPERLESHEIVRSLNTGFKHYSDSSQTFNIPDIYLDTSVVDKQRRVYTCLQLFLTLTNCGKTRPNSTLFFPAFFGKSLSLSPANVLNSSGISELLSRYPDKRFVDILIAIATTGARLGYVDPIMKQNSTTKSRFMLHARGRH